MPRSVFLAQSGNIEFPHHHFYRFTSRADASFKFKIRGLITPTFGDSSERDLSLKRSEVFLVTTATTVINEIANADTAGPESVLANRETWW